MAKAQNSTNLLLLAGAGVAGFFYLKNKGMIPSAADVVASPSVTPAPSLPQTVNTLSPSSFTVAQVPSLLPSTVITQTPTPTPSQAAVSTPYGPVTPSNFNPVPPGVTGVLAECMKRKQSDGWSVTTCETRLNALTAALNNGANAISSIQNEISNLDTAISAWQQDNVNLQAGRAAEVAAISAAGSNNPAQVEQWKSQIAARDGYIAANNQRIAAAQQNRNAQVAALSNWQSAINNNRADYFALTGVQI